MQHSENNVLMTIIIGGSTRCSNVERPIPHEQENLIGDTLPKYLNEIEKGTWEFESCQHIDYNIREIYYEDVNSRQPIQTPTPPGICYQWIGSGPEPPELIEATISARILIYNDPSDLEEYYRREQAREDPKIIRDIIVERPSDCTTIETFHQFGIECRKYRRTYGVLLCMSVDEEQINHFETIRENIENNRPLSQEPRYRPSTIGGIIADIRDTETHPRDRIPEILSESYILTIYNLWEQNYRGKIAKEQLVPKCKVKWDLMGELRNARTHIAHPTNNGSKPKVLKTLRKLWKMNESDNRPTPNEIVAKLGWDIDKANIGIDKNFNIRIE